ncbi:amino acid adenylation domain-containing protein [Amycolatopsis xylanica]|uniref:Amino acid adenylation domain-containing protein n=1 Tax=Amycolatopsis xylanica TaxID=589385 RepID=A0A1H3NNC8_9PSEU|nr:AMP-binding protein [Amycolatopsis xylanica]SDY90253.1 amino acid adenylation domain-containing protein [Amycolatopsis xylanica]
MPEFDDLRRWNDTAVDFPALSLPALLRRAARLRPDTVALSTPERKLTYRALIGEVDRAVSCLRARGVGRGSPVVCVLPRGVAAVVAQAAVFARGAVYVPVAEEAPVAVLEQALGGFGAPFLLTDQVGLARLDHEIDPAIRRICFVEPWLHAGDESVAPCPDPSLDDLAYVVHTSGRSGRPKAVMVSHRAIANSTQARLLRYPFPVGEFAFLTPMTVDTGFAGIWWTLASGGTLRLLSADPARAVGELAEVLRSGTVTHTMVTPSLYRSVLPTVEHPSPSLRQVVVSGEPVPADLVAEHYARLPRVDLVNEYGPAETSVWCAGVTLRPGEDVTVGTPIANTQLWVLDEERPLPPGRFGEVCVAGTALADGYLGDPDATRERFVPHPFEAGKLLYRTGDVGRWRDDGRFELRGRLDDQARIHGIRVEPSGVAMTLASHPAVRQAVVVARPLPGHYQDRLVAYVTPHWRRDPQPVELTSSYTGERLPVSDRREWIDHSVGLACERPAGSVLELGCGTGLLLTRLARECTRYVGTDASADALDVLAARVSGMEQVELRCEDVRTALRDRFAEFDLVLCNSVPQYFPSPAFLTEVLEGAVRACRRGGRVILGDILDFGLREAFHASVVLAAADEDVPAQVLEQRLRQRLDLDPLLWVDARWFARAVASLGRFADVQVRPRRGRGRTEMTDFRFDVVLCLDTEPEVLELDDWWFWADDALDARALRKLLTASTSETVGVLGITNQRTAGACAVRDALAQPGFGEPDCRGLRWLAAEAERAAVHPEELAELAEELGWELRLSRAAGLADGALDAVFHRPGPAEWTVRWPNSGQVVPERCLSTDPLHRHVIADARERLVPELREYAAELLCAHERPAEYVVLAELPLTAHGKVDHAALPSPPGRRPELGTGYARPASPIEERVAEIFAELLGIDRVGRFDDFVELGGDSLLAVRAAVLIEAEFAVRLPIRIVFDLPTPQLLAGRLSVSPAEPAAVEAEAPDEDDRLPLTVPQLLLWGHDSLLGGDMVAGPDCALTISYRVHGPLNVPVLAEAVDELVNRHEALRTSLHLPGGQLENGYQRVGPARSGVLRVVDAERLDAAAVLRALQVDEPLDPGSGRVFAAELARVSDVEALFSLRIHHLVADGWSMALIERELTRLYEGIVTGRGPDLPTPPSYRAQVRHATTPSTRDPIDPADIAYWAWKVRGAKPVELVPSEYLEIPVEPPRTEVRSILVPPDEAEPFLRLARARRATLYTALYTVFASIIAADTADPDVRLLSVNAARRSADLERTVGLFLDAVFLREQVHAGLSFADLLTVHGRELHDALRHDSVPMLGLCRALPEMLDVFGRSQSVVFESLVPLTELRLTGCSVQRRDQYQEGFTGRVPQIPAHLAVATRQESSSLRLAALYDPGFVPKSYVDDLLRRMRAVVVACGRDGALAPGAVVKADHWLETLRMVRV